MLEVIILIILILVLYYYMNGVDAEHFVPGPLPPEYSYFLPNQPSCFYDTEGYIRCNDLDRYLWGWYDLSTQSKITIPKSCFPYGYPVVRKDIRKRVEDLPNGSPVARFRNQ